MVDILVIFIFLTMVLAPCLVAMATGIPTGAELGARDPSEPRYADSDHPYIPD
jgi:hypothetical protein